MVLKMDGSPSERTDMFNRANALANAGLHEEAVPYFQALGDGGEENAWLNLGLSLFALGRLAEAEVAFSTGASLGDMKAEYELALVLDETEREEKALQLHASLFARGLNESAMFLAFDAQERGDVDEAKKYLRPLLDRDDDVAAIASGMWGCILWRFDGDVGAEPYLREGSHVHALALFDLVRLLAATDRLDEAHEIVQRALDNGVDGAVASRDYLD
jgi:tetratricopeptide (TPR) repeat protein